MVNDSETVFNSRSEMVFYSCSRMMYDLDSETYCPRPLLSDLKQSILNCIVLGHSGTTQNKPFWMGQNYLFQNDILWAFENDFRSSRPFFGASRMALYARSEMGVQLQFQTTPDSARVISPTDGRTYRLTDRSSHGNARTHLISRNTSR